MSPQNENVINLSLKNPALSLHLCETLNQDRRILWLPKLIIKRPLKTAFFYFYCNALFLSPYKSSRRKGNQFKIHTFVPRKIKDHACT